MTSTIEPMKVKVNTQIHENGDIEQNTHYPSGEMQRMILKTQEKQVHDGLIALGWTPPENLTVDDAESLDDNNPNI